MKNTKNMNKYIAKAESTLDRIIGWINNCDQKASMLLALLGVFVTFFVTSDYVKFIKHHLWDPFAMFINTHNGNVHVGRLLSALCLLIVLVCLTATFYYLLNTIRPRTKKQNDKKVNTSNDAKKEIIVPSKTFYGDIASCKTFEDFQNMKTDYDLDIENQIWQNGRICNIKFDNLKHAVRWLLSFLISFIVFVITLLFV